MSVNALHPRSAAPFLRLIVVAAVSGGAACGPSTPATALDAGVDLVGLSASPDLSEAPDIAIMAPTPLPQLTATSGVVIAKLQLVTISFADSMHVQAAESFGDYVGTSAWLKAWGPEYGVLAVTHLKKVQLAENAPAMLTDVRFESYIKGLISDGKVPAPSPQILYMFYFPQTSSIVDDGNATLCDQFSGYHSYSSVGATRFTYAAIGDCMDGDDGATVTASHELAEAATDPFLDNLTLQADGHDPWSIENGEEAGDMCESSTAIHMDGFAMQRIWSNAAAARGVDPCVPMAPPVYMNVYATPAIIPEVAAGEKVSFRLTGWSTGTTAPWKISLDAATGSDFNVTSQQAVLSAMTIFNHNSVTLTLIPPADAVGGSLGGVVVHSGPDNNTWAVAYSVK